MIRRAQPWLGTLVDISIVANGDPAAIPAALTAAFADIALVHRLMSFHAGDSDVARFNQAAVGALVEIDAHTWNVLRLAAQIGVASDGCFDVGCAPRLVEWGYLPAPSADAPAFTPGRPCYQLAPHNGVRKLTPGWIDLGGIAKGYAVDLAIDTLVAHGVAEACVNAGGDLRVIGPAAWPIAVRAPHDPAAIGARAELRDAALATSGIYFSARRLHNEQHVNPLIDGRNGQASGMARSISVRAPTCAVADALTKIVMATGDAAHPCLAQFDAAAFII
jgi:thiamine biosynthesis lipoprotein